MCLSTYNKLGTGVAFYHQINKSLVQDNSVQFVDDTSHFLNPLGANLTNDSNTDVGSALLPFASNLSQIWADSIWLSGGGGVKSQKVLLLCLPAHCQLQKEFYILC